MSLENGTVRRRCSNARFAAQLAAITIGEYESRQNFIIEPIGVMNHLCGLLDTVDGDTRRKITDLVTIDSAKSKHVEKKRNDNLLQLFSTDEKQTDKMFVSTDCSIDQGLNEGIRTQFATTLKMVNFATSTDKAIKKIMDHLTPKSDHKDDANASPELSSCPTQICSERSENQELSDSF